MRDGIIHSRLELSAMTLSGVDEDPARFVQPVAGSHFNAWTCEVVAVLKAQTSKMSPLCTRTAAGY